MGARWAWDAVCSNGHVYGNFSGGADDCYECGAEPLVEFATDDSRSQAEEYARKVRAGLAGEAVLNYAIHCGCCNALLTGYETLDEAMEHAYDMANDDFEAEKLSVIEYDWEKGWG